MKKLTFLLSVVVYLAFAKANTARAQQEFKGVAYYTSKTTFKMKKDTASVKQQDPEKAEMQAMIREAFKKGSTADFKLEFSQTESMYEKEVELVAPKPSSGASITFSSSGPTSSTIYKNLQDQEFIMKDQIFGKDFLITDKLKTYQWQPTQETKQIGNYTCYKATYTPELTEEQKKAKEEKKEDAKKGSLFALMDDVDPTIEVWYTPEIPIANGPGEYHGLPGLILEVKERNTILLCTKIVMNPEEDFEIDQPRGGKTITQEKFDALQKKKMEEYQKKNGTKGFIVREVRTSN
ncbi:GLPGLI family protein [Nonlabens ponticola]|uniref:GLPGLI family protein n=1 Tax=Nonlabens ponticola TaxID=2496866 RepID=A0A3S9MW77_9FLAO|nr:GLPGLI family protein [Nonlabens ponticola]AZQ43461.1 GLPGLI family protein [Nonlabens ponticola]